MMRVSLLLVLAIIPAAAQSPLARLLNVSRPTSSNFQIGDRFEILITGAPNQPVSVRTAMHGRTDWGPILGSTDSTGRWSVSGQFEKRDFGDWNQVWTVGGKLASPAIRFSVNAPCLPGGQGFASVSGPNLVLTCETADRRQTFVTPSFSDPFRTPDGRLVPGRATQQTPEQYHTEILQNFITSPEKEMKDARISLQSSTGGLGDETADLISTLIGVNGLSEDEIRNSLAILRAAFEKPETIQPLAKTPARTLLLLWHLADFAVQESLKQEIAETIAYVLSR
jgi:hypothetical protein